MLPIQRDVLSGENVPCCTTTAVPFGLDHSCHRTPVVEFFVPFPPDRATECVTTRVSPPVVKLRYARRYIRRSPSESSFSLVPACGMHAPPLWQASLKAATGILNGPVK